MANDSGILTWVASPVIEEAEKELGTIDEMDETEFESAMSGEGFEVVLEDELMHDFELHTLFKPTPDNFNECSQRYNIICKEFEKVWDKSAISELIDIRMKARKHAIAGMPLDLMVSPYTDEGAALVYGYVEGSIERLKAEAQRRANFDKSYVTRKYDDGSMSVEPISSIDLVNGDF